MLRQFVPTLCCGLQDALYFTPNAWSFRDCYYVFVGDSWNVPASDAPHIAYVRSASAALRPFVAGNYINRESLYILDTLITMKSLSI